MSTFFDKLSGNQGNKNQINLAAMNTARPVRRQQEHAPQAQEAPQEDPYEKHAATATAAVATQEQSSVKTQEYGQEQEPEEEGELTVDIYNKGDAIMIQSTVAGVKPEHLDVAITDDMVTIRGRRERMDNIKEDSYYYKELFWGTFSRQVILPEEVEQDDAEAHLQHGLLTIKLPKKRHGVTQKLKVKVV